MIPGLTQWVKDLALLWLWFRLGTSIGYRCGHKNKIKTKPKKKKTKPQTAVTECLCAGHHARHRYMELMVQGRAVQSEFLDVGSSVER